MLFTKIQHCAGLGDHIYFSPKSVGMHRNAHSSDVQEPNAFWRPDPCPYIDPLCRVRSHVQGLSIFWVQTIVSPIGLIFKHIKNTAAYGECGVEETDSLPCQEIKTKTDTKRARKLCLNNGTSISCRHGVAKAQVF